MKTSNALLVISTKYYIDYVVEYENGNIVRTGYQLMRTEDDAILYANSDMRQVYAECFIRNINLFDVTIL